MNKFSFKADFFAIIVGLVVWIIGAVFLLMITGFLGGRQLRYNPNYLWLIGLLLSFAVIILVGFVGKAKGWLLGLITQFIIFIVIFFIGFDSRRDSSLLELIKNFGFYLPWFVAAGLAGWLGQKMRKFKLKLPNRNLLALFIGVIAWIIAFWAAQIIDYLIINKNFSEYFPFFSLWTFFLLISFTVSILVGWIGNSKGWILGIWFQVTIIIIIMIFTPQIPQTEPEFLLVYFYKFVPWIIAAAIGGKIGELLKK